MSSPTPQNLDQAIIDAGRALASAQRAVPRDEAVVDTARTQLLELRALRYPSG